MSQYFTIHPETPQKRLIDEVVFILEKDGVIAYPTESGYALGCLLDNNSGVERIRQIRQLSHTHEFTLMCKDLSNISCYAKIGNVQFRYLKSHFPGPYTIVLPASKEVPKRLQNLKKKTIGIRVSENKILNTMLNSLDKPLISSSLIIPDNDLPATNAWEVKDSIENSLDAIVDGGFCDCSMTTIIDFTDDVPTLIRQGKGVFNL